MNVKGGKGRTRETWEVGHGEVEKWISFMLGVVSNLTWVILCRAVGIDGYLVWTGSAALALPCILFAARRFPAAFIPPVVFVGALKSAPAVGLDPKDPTFIVLIILSATVLFELLFLFSGSARCSVSELFRGQFKALAAYVLFAGTVAFSYLYTPAPIYGGEKVVKFLVIGSLMFFSPLILLKEGKDLRHLFITIILLASILTAKRLFIILSYTHWVPNEDITHMGAGTLIGMAALILIEFRLIKTGIRRQLLLFLGLPWLLLGVVVSAARGPVIALLLSLFVGLLVFSGRDSLLSSKAAASGLLILLMATFIMAMSVIPRAAQGKIEGKVTEIVSLQKNPDQKGSAGERLRSYKSALAAFADYPVMGLGVGGWSTYYGGQDDRTYPHNLVLEIAAEEGLVGLVSLFGFLGLAVLTACRVFDQTRRHLGFFVLVLILVLGEAMFSGDLDSAQVPWMWCGVTFAVYRMVITGRLKPVDLGM